MTTRVQRSSGNAFLDVGFEAQEAENLRLRSQLMIRIEKVIHARGLTQKEAARLLRVSQPRISDLVRGRLDRFSIDSLVEMLGLLGLEVRVTTHRRRRVA